MPCFVCSSLLDKEVNFTNERSSHYRQDLLIIRIVGCVEVNLSFVAAQRSLINLESMKIIPNVPLKATPRTGIVPRNQKLFVFFKISQRICRRKGQKIVGV